MTGAEREVGMLEGAVDEEVAEGRGVSQRTAAASRRGRRSLSRIGYPLSMRGLNEVASNRCKGQVR